MVSQHVVLTGELDPFAAPTACRVLDTIDGPAVVDLGGVTLLSAAALTELVRLAKRVGYQRVRLVGARPPIRRILELMGFDKLFVIE